MAKKLHGLGRGLDSLLPETEETWGTSVREISVDEIDPNPDQPRRTFDEEGISQLAQSVRDQGILQPLLVAPSENGRYRIIAGERRYRASRAAGMDTVPCIVRDLDVIKQMEIALIENMQREDLNPLEAAQGVKALMQQCGYTQEKVSARLGKSRPAVANLLRLLTLPPEVTDLLRQGLLSAGHARVLAGLESDERKISLARKTVADGLSVRALEQLAAEQKNVRPAEKHRKELPAELKELEERLLEKTGMRSTLTGSVNKGKIVLQYGTRDELERLYELLERLN
ncbi:MAG: ParB/RepB/Spo0J family partition protein [Clostridia bacterium]|nr:ParB/RepB/Spo0J family partition protein [Clostridia bacterium]